MCTEHVAEQDFGLGDLANKFSLGTGFACLDEVFGGYAPGSLTLIGGAASAGKTTFALQTAAHAAIERGEKALFVTFGSGGWALVRRLLCLKARVDPFRLSRNRCSSEELGRLWAEIRRLKAAPFAMRDAFGLPFGEAARLVDEHYDWLDLDSPAQLRLAVFDGLPRMAVGDRRPAREKEAGYIAESLRTMAESLGIAVLLVAETGDYCQEWDMRPPRPEDLRHYYSIARHADAAILLHRPALFDRKAPRGQAEAVVRCRKGWAGFAGCGSRGMGRGL